MDNSNRDSADNRPTQQLWPTPEPGGSGGDVPNPPGPSQPGPNPGGPGPRRGSRVTRWGIGIAAAAVLIGGGAVAVATSGQPASPSGQAATLNTVLSSADSPSAADLAAASPTTASPSTGRSAAGTCARAAKRLRATHRQATSRHPAIARRVRAVCRRRLGRVRLLVRGIHGQFTYQTKKGTKTLAFERGTIQSVSGSSVTIAAPDGTTWTWHLVSNSVVRQGGRKVASTTLATGQHVFAGGPVVSGSDDARLIVIRPAKTASGSTSSAPAS